MVILSMNGLTVEESQGIRESLAEGGAMLHMVRNSLAKLALKDCGVEIPDGVFEGNIAIVCGAPEEAIHAAKVLKKSDARKDGKIDFRAGLLEGAVLDATEVQSLAEMPDANTLRAMLLGVLSGPARQLVGLINAPTSALVRVIQARVDKAGAPASDEG
jgi:large subunit ribosomal protein L10